jgi:hypothetical protein
VQRENILKRDYTKGEYHARRIPCKGMVQMENITKRDCVKAECQNTLKRECTRGEYPAKGLCKGRTMDVSY